MRRVLVVDDEENIRLVLRTLLRKHGYDVEVADSGETALAMVDTFGPDVILTDVRMPKMGGLDLLATATPAWLQDYALAEWLERYSGRSDEWRLPRRAKRHSKPPTGSAPTARYCSQPCTPSILQHG